MLLVDFGSALDRREVVQHAVREGARHGVAGDSVADIQQWSADQSQGVLSPSNIAVCYVDENGNGYPGDAGDSVRVTANYTYQFTVGGGEMLTAFGVAMPSIDMSPLAEARLETAVSGAVACPP